MARIDNLTNYLTDVASAIKQKKGSQTNIPAADFDTEILALPSGGTYQTKSITISTNTATIVTPDTGYDAITQMTITTSVPTGQMKEYASETAMNNDIANIQEGEVVRVVETPMIFSDGNTYSIPDITLDDNSNLLITYYPYNDKIYVSFFVYPNTYTMKKRQEGNNFYFNLYDSNGVMINDSLIRDIRYVDGSFYNESMAGGATFVDGMSIYSNVTLYDTNNQLVFEPASAIVTLYLKETTMKKLVKEEDTISPEEYVEDVGLTEDILGGEPVPPEPEIQDHYEIEYVEID